MTDIKSLFLIDDDRIFNMIHTRIIHNTDYNINIQPFHNARHALKVLRELVESDPFHFPDLIFLDINMPGMDGWEFLEEFGKLPESAAGNCEVVMLSSSIDPMDIEKSKTYSKVKVFVSKPLTPGKLQTLFG
jgi:CheY-like chemotaxis protein